MIRRFLDPAVAEPSAATQPFNIASLMARHGVKNESEQSVAVPIEIKEEVKEEVTAKPEVTPVETTTEPSIAEAKTETPAQVQEQVVEMPQKEEQPKVPTLQEVLRQHQPEAILKELGYNDKLVSLVNQLKEYDPKVAGLIQAYKDGVHVEYLKELTTDYSKMPAEEVMRHQLRREYPKASEKALDVLYRKEITEKYNLDSADDAELEEGKLLLEAKAERYRDEFISKQSKFLLPKAPEPKADVPDLSEQKRQQEIEAYRSQFSDNAYTKNIFTSKSFSLGEGDEKFNYPVDPEVLSGVLFDDNKWAETQFDIHKNIDGTIKYTPKVEHQMLTAMVAVYGKSFLDAYSQHLKSLGGKAAIVPIDNAKPVETSMASPAQAAPKSAAEAMARGGTLNSGGR